MESKDVKITATTEPKPRAVVCLYSHEDEPFYLQFKKSLNLLERQEQIRWLEVLAGEELATIWQRNVKVADLILLLLSPDFFADELCYQTMHLALQERMSRQVSVVPVLVRAVSWRLSACKDLAIVPHNEQPVASWPLPDEAYASIGADLARLVPGWPPIPSPAHSKLFQARKLPEGYVPRPKAFDAIKQVLLSRKRGQATAITTALRGAGGFGKTTLALALCHDQEIQEAFPDGILWVELGEHPSRPRDVLNGILASVEPSRTEAVTLEEAKKRWQAALHDRVCLLVIDDVWQVEVLLPLLEGGPHCRRLVTTRNDLLLPRDAARVLVDAMEPHEAVAVLCQGLSEAIPETVYQSSPDALAARLGYWPLLLTLANGLLTDFVDAQMSLSEALTTVTQAYETRGVAAFRLDNVEERQRTVDACLRVSLEHLETFTHTHYHALERYQELAVFPEDTDIPINTLQIYWKGSAGLEIWETQNLCIRLHRLSLLLTCDLGKGTIRLHDVMRSYLQQQVGPQMQILHTRLLSAYWRILGLKRWVELPIRDVYLWQYLIWHLCRTGRRESLQATLTDLGYLTRKALYVGVPALEADLLLASTVLSTETAKSAVSFFTLLHRRIVLISHLLLQAKLPAEMGGLLLSYLGWETAFAAQRSLFESELPRPFLTAWHPLPDGISSMLLRTLDHHGGVLGCAVSPDGRFLVSASANRTLKVWDTATGTERFALSGHTYPVSSCAVSPDGRFLVSASWDNTLKVWNASTGAELRTLSGHTAWVNSCAVSPDGRHIISASKDRTLKMWDASTGRELRTFSGHTDDVKCCAVSPDGRFLVSASKDRTLKMWDASTGRELRTLSGHTGWVLGCAVSPDGRLIVSASNDNTLKVWNAATGAELLTLSGHTAWVNSCAVSPDGRLIVSASDDNTLKGWDAATGAELFSFKGHTGSVHSCVVSPDGRFIVSAAGSTLKMWSTATEADHVTLSGHTSFVSGCAVSPDGRLIVSASDDNTLKVWNAATGAELLTLSGHTDGVNSCAVSPNGRLIVSASWDNTLKVWDTATGALRLTFSGHTNGVNSCAVGSNGRLIVSASDDNTLKVWNAATGAELLTLSGHTDTVSGCAVSPNGRFIISASYDSTLKVWNAATGAELLTLSGHTDKVNGCAISPDGRLIVSASADETLKVWDATTGAELLTLRGHHDAVNGCAVSGNGLLIVSVSNDHTFKVWNIETGHYLLTFPVDGALYGCVFHPDGKHLVGCGDRGMFFLRLVR